MLTIQDILQIYINKANSFPYRYKIGDNYWTSSNPKDITLSDWYKEARRVWLIPFTFEDFKWMVLQNKTSLNWKYYRYRPKKFSWSWNYENRNCVCRKYKKQPHHKPKELNETQIAKNDYRLKKGTAKDKSKAYYRRGAGKFYKQLSNQMHRAWQADKLSKADYNFNNNDYKFFCDKWMWD